MIENMHILMCTYAIAHIYNTTCDNLHLDLSFFLNRSIGKQSESSIAHVFLEILRASLSPQQVITVLYFETGLIMPQRKAYVFMVSFIQIIMHIGDLHICLPQFSINEMGVVNCCESEQPHCSVWYLVI